MTARAGQSGVTLIEMLVALSVFSLIGIASFSVLDTIARTDRQTAGRLEEFSQIDLTLRLFEADVLRASAEYTVDEKVVSLITEDGRINYWHGPDGLYRQIVRPDQPETEQLILPPPYLAHWRIQRPGDANASEETSTETVAIEMILIPGNDDSRATRKLVPLTPVTALPE